MSDRALLWLAIAGAIVPLAAGAAHVLELPNKLGLEGLLWLEVQQQMYRGWGSMIAPFELVAIAASWLLAWRLRDARDRFSPVLTAAFCLSAALVLFFVWIAPVNEAFASWSAATLPADWPRYRLRWETGHVAHFALVVTAFVALLRTAFVAGPRRPVRASSQRAEASTVS